MLTAHKKLTAFFILLTTMSVVTAQDKATDFSHQRFAAILSQYVEDGVVDYPSINKSTDYHNYLASLQDEITFDTSADKLAYLINAYNALAIKGILDGRSPESFFGKIGYFYNAEYMVYGKKLNLYDFEHQYILTLGEPRVHFALNCASASCPKLYKDIYQGQILEQQLETATTAFINDTTRNKYDLTTKTAYLSKIFDWFDEDFIKHSGSVQQFLALYVTDSKISNALANNEFEIEYLDYDWSLNGIAPETE